MPIQFSDDWITAGWSRDTEGKWIELGGIPGIVMTPSPVPPQLTVHQIADKLNDLEAQIGATHAGL